MSKIKATTNVGHRARLKDKLLKSDENLPDYEILELLLFNAIPRKDVKPLAKSLLHKYQTIGKIINLPLTELSSLPKAIHVLFKLMQATIARVNKEQIIANPVINNWNSLLTYIRTNIGYKNTECLKILFLNHKNILITEETIEYGTINSVAIYPREILKKAIFHNASSIVLAHNHPSGITTPSASDISMTQQVKEVLAPLNISLVDHIIISSNSHYSFKQNNLI